MSDIRENFQQHVAVSAALVAKDLAALLNRSHSLGFAVCPDVDEEGASYSVEWAFNGECYSLDVEWDPNASEWTWMYK
jgi:hypothetical protein